MRPENPMASWAWIVGGIVGELLHDATPRCAPGAPASLPAPSSLLCAPARNARATRRPPCAMASGKFGEGLPSASAEQRVFAALPDGERKLLGGKGAMLASKDTWAAVRSARHTFLMEELKRNTARMHKEAGRTQCVHCFTALNVQSWYQCRVGTRHLEDDADSVLFPVGDRVDPKDNAQGPGRYAGVVKAFDVESGYHSLQRADGSVVEVSLLAAWRQLEVSKVAAEQGAKAGAPPAVSAQSCAALRSLVLPPHNSCTEAKRQESDQREQAEGCWASAWRARGSAEDCSRPQTIREGQARRRVDACCTCWCANASAELV